MRKLETYTTGERKLGVRKDFEDEDTSYKLSAQTKGLGHHNRAILKNYVSMKKVYNRYKLQQDI